MIIELYGFIDLKDTTIFEKVKTFRVKKKVVNTLLYEDVIIWKNRIFVINFISEVKIKASLSKFITIK